jgi:protein O-GlcNAc transferase
MTDEQKALSIRRALAVAVQHRQAGRHDQAESVCNEILKAEPASADAYYLLAMVAQDRGRPDAAVALLSKAIAHKPDNAAYHNNLGAILRGQRRLEEAMAEYRAALSLRNDLPEAHLGAGHVHRDLGRADEAEACFRKALALKPDFIAALYGLGTLLQTSGRIDEAAACYERVIAINPGVPEVLNNLGVIRNQKKEHGAAIESYRRALELRPAYADARYNLGNAYKDTGRYAEAAACYRQATEAQPAFADAYINLGNLEKEAGNLREALALYRKAAEAQPGRAEAWHNIGTVLRQQGDAQDAERCFRRALELDPDFSDAAAKLANLLHDQGKSGEAIAFYRKALASNPDNAQALYLYANQLQMVCEWNDLPDLSTRIRRAVNERPDALIDPFELIALGAAPEEQLRCAEKWTTRYFSPVPQLCGSPVFAFTRSRKPRLRIGYLSGDFRMHVLSVLAAELFEIHDRSRFEIIGYSYGPEDGSPMRRRIGQAFDRFVDIRDRSNLEAARKIHEDGIDILVDLTVHTKGSRSHIMALRPAPVQVNYLGYPGTVGGAFIDYIVADRFIIPPASARFYSEKPVYLPDTYQVNDRKRTVGRPTSRAEHCVPDGALAFCCFNQSYKYMPEMFDVWMRILAQVPGSVLWLSADNPWVQTNLKREAQARRIDPQRLVFATKLPFQDHLARMRLADLFLDTLPYNAHATASDALWVGLPVLTCAGHAFASRVAGSLLRAVGLPELVTDNLGDYEKTAVALGSDRDKLKQLRARLQANRDTAPLFDTPRTAAHLEQAYELMWERYAAGLPADAIEVPARARDSSRPS